MASVVITAADETRWGEAPYAVTRRFRDETWTFLAVSGTGATRTFVFKIQDQLVIGGFAALDVDVYAGAGKGNLGPGSRSATAFDTTSMAAYGPEEFRASPLRSAPARSVRLR